MDIAFAGFLGFVAAFIGFSILNNYSNGVRFKPISIFWIGLSLLWLWFFGLEFYKEGSMSRLVVFAFLFHVFSPAFGSIWWGHDRTIRKGITKTVIFAFLWCFGMIAYVLLSGSQNFTVAAIVGLVFAIVGIIP